YCRLLMPPSQRAIRWYLSRTVFTSRCSHFTCHRTPAVVTAPPPGSVRLFNQNYPAAPTPFGNGMPLAMLAAQRPVDGNNLGARKNLEYIGNRHSWLPAQ